MLKEVMEFDIELEQRLIDMRDCPADDIINAIL